MGLFRGLFVRPDDTRGTGPSEARLALAGLLTADGDLGILPGVLSGMAVTGIASTWAYAVAAGHVGLSRGATDGAVLTGTDGTTQTPTVPAAPGSGSRWDLIWVRHRDVDASDADSEVILGVTSGTASGSPSKPYGDVPAGALVLAEAQVGAGATGTLHANVTIAQVAARIAARGGIVPVTSSLQSDALDAVASASNPVWVDDNGMLKRSVGSGWETVAGVPVLGAFTYGAAWRTPTTQAGLPITLVKRGSTVTMKAGAFENATSLTLPATGQNAGALTFPTGFRPAGKLIIPAFITNTSAAVNQLGSLWVLSTGGVTFQTAGAITSAPAGTISVAVGDASWEAAS